MAETSGCPSSSATSGAAPPREARGPHPNAILARLLADPETVERAVEWCRRTAPTWPDGCSTLLAWRLFEVAGLAIPYAPLPAELVPMLRARRWVMGAAGVVEPRSGDLAVMHQAEHPVRVAVVARTYAPAYRHIRDVMGVRYSSAWVELVDTDVAAPWRPRRVLVDELVGRCWWLRRPG